MKSGCCVKCKYKWRTIIYKSHKPVFYSVEHIKYIRCWQWDISCIKNRPDSVLEIAAWAKEHLQKSLSVNTAHCAIKAPSMLKGLYRFQSNICSHPDDVFFREGLACFSRTKLNHILHLFQQHGFVVEESGRWTDLPAVQTFHHMKTFKIQQRRARTAEQLESSIRQEWDNIPLPKVQQLVSSVPDV